MDRILWLLVYMLTELCCHTHYQILEHFIPLRKPHALATSHPYLVSMGTPPEHFNERNIQRLAVCYGSFQSWFCLDRHQYIIPLLLTFPLPAGAPYLA